MEGGDCKVGLEYDEVKTIVVLERGKLDILCIE